MTKMAQAPSLSQARVQSSNNNNHHQHHHRHLHSHLRSSRHPQAGDTTNNHIRLDEQSQQPHQRDVPELDNRLTEVVHTVSVVQVVNESGAAVATKTFFPDTVSSIDSVPRSVETAPGLTAGASTVDSSASTAAAASSPSDDAYPTATGSDLSSASSSLSVLSALSESGTVTSAPSSTFTSFPSLSGSYNSTTRPSFYNSTSVHLFPNTTSTAFHSNTSSSFSFSTSSSSSGRTSSTDVPAVSIDGGADGTAGVGAGAGATASPAPTSTSTSSNPTSGALDPTTSSVIGGIVGGVAGIAIVALVLMMFIKWRRAQGNGIKLLGDGKSPSGRLSLFSNRGGPGDGGGGMTGPSGSTFGVPAALASLAAYKQSSQQSQQPMIEGTPDSSEKGFYRVSGRKLVSVLESGGDGYADPPGSRDSRLSATTADNRLSTVTADNRMSGASFWRPDSMAFLSTTASPLQLGSPMRPESGIMVMRNGPARTPIQEQGPTFDDTRSPTPPTPPTTIDPLGRSLLAQAGSGVSASRFTEAM